MSLPSQRGKTSGKKVDGGYRPHKRNRRRPPWLVISVVLLAVVTISAWGVMQWLGSRPVTGEAGEPIAEGSEQVEPIGKAVSNDPALAAILGGSGGDDAQAAQPDPGLIEDEPQTGLLSGVIAAGEPEPEPEPSASHGTPPADDLAGETTIAIPLDPVDEPEVPSPIDDTGPVEPVSDTPVDALARGEELIADERWVEARALLSDALKSGDPSAADAAVLRDRLGAISDVLVFSKRIAAGDTMCSEYRIEPGDSLGKIAGKKKLGTHWKFISRINGITDPGKIQVGQRLKLVRGPFHAVISKSTFRLDLYHGSPESPGEWVFIRSFRVGLGEDDGTPTGSFVVSANKLENPGWVNPRDGTESYAPGDPNNPIGKFWIGLDGLGDDAKHVGYGLHGTIEPQSIGRNMSMGCVRLVHDDIALLYEMLGERRSVVHIVE